MAELERQKKLEREKRLAEEKESNARSAARQEEKNATSALEEGKPALPPLKPSRRVGSSQSRSCQNRAPRIGSPGIARARVVSFVPFLPESALNYATAALEGGKAAAPALKPQAHNLSKPFRRVGSSQSRSGQSRCQSRFVGSFSARVNPATPKSPKTQNPKPPKPTTPKSPNPKTHKKKLKSNHYTLNPYPEP